MMKNFWKRYWEWSDKINAPFQQHKNRLALYVILGQTIIVTVALLQLSHAKKQQFVCNVIDVNTMYCLEQ